MAIELTDANFEEVVLKSDKPVLVDFWAEWCGPCRMVGPIVEELNKDYEGKAVVGKVELSIQAYASRCAEFGQGQSRTRFKPHGVMAVLGPFNFPAHLPNGHIVPALLAGNTVVFKPSESVPTAAQLMMACWQEAGFPAGSIAVALDTGAGLTVDDAVRLAFALLDGVREGQP